MPIQGPKAVAPAHAIDPPRRGRVYRRAGKRALDILLVLAFLPVYLPFIAVAACLLFVEGGNPFYRQPRLGLNGERFSILKLRTMVRDADKKLNDLLAADPELKREWDVSQKLKKDPADHPCGRIAADDVDGRTAAIVECA